MFCEGLSLDAKGRVVATGERNSWAYISLELMIAGGNDAAKTSIYDPGTNAWTAEGQMKIPRGYHSVSFSRAVSFWFVLHFQLQDSWWLVAGVKHSRILCHHSELVTEEKC